MSYNLCPGFPEIGPMVDQLLTNARGVCLVGWREPRDNDTLNNLIARQIPVIHVIDAWAENIQHLQDWLGTDHPNVYPLVRDVRVYLTETRKHPFDVIIWQHGPEHLHKGEALSLLETLQERYAGLILEAPHGPYPQGPIYGNPYEIHESSWYYHDFEELGCTTAASFEGEHIIAVWQREG